LKRMLGLTVIATALLYGCGENNPPPFDPHPSPSGVAPEKSTAAPGSRVAFASEMDTVIAHVTGEPVTMRQLVDPLVKAHGLDFLLHLVQLDLVKQYAKKSGIIVTARNIDDERQMMLDRMFKDADDARLIDALERALKEKRSSDVELLRSELESERGEFLEQFLTAKHMARVEFDMLVETDAYLRKLAEPQVAPKITEEALKATWGQLYGEHIFVKYMSLVNMDEVLRAKRRMAEGESFEVVAREMSQDPRTAGLGGELPGFTRTTKIPGGEAFKDAAFSLKDNEVSDVVAMGTRYTLIKRIRVEPPQTVKYEDVKQIVYRTLYDAQLRLAIGDLKKELEKEARDQLKIIDPLLSQQYSEKVEHQGRIEQKTKANMARQVRLQELLRAPGTTQPSAELLNKIKRLSAPTTDVAPQTAPAQVGERPPATQGSK
jgi:hypothetical protein